MNIKAIGKDRRMGDKAKVLVDVLDRSFFRDRDDICLFSKIRATGLHERRYL